MYQDCISWLEEVPGHSQKDGTRNMRRLLEKLGHPERSCAVVHTAGTNGKGSCCAMLASILQKAGYRTALYTSPHLIDYTERIQVNGQKIPEEDFERLCLEVRSAIAELLSEGFPHATFFEILTAMGFLYARQQQADVLVLETGVGGRLDATNVVEKPQLLLTLITSISLDHMKALGTTLPAIAGEKAGILREGVPVVLAKNPDQVQQVIREKAVSIGAPYTYAGDLSRCAGYTIGLDGIYEQENLAAVLAGVDCLRGAGLLISEDALREGLARTTWPARMQQAVFLGKPALLDGAHNPGGAAMLAQYLQAHYPQGACTLVFSALCKKDTSRILGIFRDCPAIGRAVFTCIHEEDSLDAFRQIWEAGAGPSGLSKPYLVEKDPARAFEKAFEMPGTQQVTAAGSLYLAGELMKAYPDIFPLQGCV